MTLDNVEYIQSVLFPINNDDNVFIFPSNLTNKLPKSAIDVIQPSQKYIAPFSIKKLINSKIKLPNTYDTIQYIPRIHLQTIKQLLNLPSSTLKIGQKSLENHLTSNNTLDSVIKYLLNDYKYGESLNINNEHDQNKLINKLQQSTLNYCTVDILTEFEERFNFKYVILDKLLGIGMVHKPLFEHICNVEIDKILIPVKYHHNPAIIRDKAIAFVYKHQNILHHKNKMPNQSLMDVIDDLHRTTNGYFIWNPIYKAHKTDENGNHTPRIRPIISGTKSPLRPILKLIAEGCIKMIHVIQNMYNINNVIQDSFHTINIINEYIKCKFHPNDIILTMDFVSFYTELQTEFINDKLDYIHKLFKTKYENESRYEFHIYTKIVEMIKDGYTLASKYCIIKIDDKYFIQKQGVIMGASFAPNLANLTILVHNIQKEIYKCKAIKLNIRMIDDTLMILNSKYNININDIYKQYYPHNLQYTFKIMNNNKLQFLDIRLIKINNTLQYIMQIKMLKLVFFVPFKSNHPKHIKINIVKNMINRAVVLCSNKILFFHTYIAIKKRFKRSGYPESFLFKYMNVNAFKNRYEIINKLNYNRNLKCNNMIKQNKIKYKPMWVPGEEKGYISILYDNILQNNPIHRSIKQYIRMTHPNKKIVYTLNDSIQKIIRCKDAKYNAL